MTTLPLPKAWTLLIDGRSGAGKTSLATQLAKQMTALGPPPTVIRLDDCYPGWNGLEIGAQDIINRVLIPRSQGEAPSWRRYDWVKQAFTERHAVPNDLPLIVEGCGILTPISASLADWTIWVDADAQVRYQRAMERDGDTFRPYWDLWAEQERDHMRRDRPIELADQFLKR